MDDVTTKMIQAVTKALYLAGELAKRHESAGNDEVTNAIRWAESKLSEFTDQENAKLILGTGSATFANSDGIVGMTAKQRRALIGLFSFLSLVEAPSFETELNLNRFMMEWEFPQMWAEATQEEE